MSMTVDVSGSGEVLLRGSPCIWKVEMSSDSDVIFREITLSIMVEASRGRTSDIVVAVPIGEELGSLYCSELGVY